MRAIRFTIRAIRIELASHAEALRLAWKGDGSYDIISAE